MSTELGTYKRIASVTISVVASGVAGPVGGVKIAVDVETGKDLYAITVFSWVLI